MLKNRKPRYFPDPDKSPRIVQRPGLETTILTGLSGQKMIMERLQELQFQYP